jgi:hypothetical protein
MAFGPVGLIDRRSLTPVAGQAHSLSRRRWAAMRDEDSIRAN